MDVDKEYDELFGRGNDNANKEERNDKGNSTKINKALDTIKEFTHNLFIDEYKNPYAVIPIEDHLEVFAINSKNFKNWCRMTVYKKNGINIDSQTLSDMCSLLSAYAQFESKEQISLNLRTASNMNNNELEWIYDLTNKNWEFVKITPSYWSIIKNEIIFRRYNNQQPQVYPLKEYEPDIFDKFMKLVNIKSNDEETKLLLKCYIISLFIPDIQKPVLMLHGSRTPQNID
jgi:hypothetical protein